MVRYERKYYISNEKLEGLRKMLLAFVNPDDYSKAVGGLSQYTVRSIYYDTPAMEYYYEKKEGLERRSKFRIRVYDQYRPGSVAFLEIKRKLGNRIRKHRSTVLVDHLKDLLHTGNAEEYIIRNPKLPKAEADASRFLYHYYRKSLRPANLIVYDREAYHGKFDPGVRITFDKNVRSTLYPRLEELYGEERAKAITPGHFILEIKYYHSMPAWARAIVEEFQGRLEAISKYASGMDIHYPFYTRMRHAPVTLSRAAYNDDSFFL